MAKTACYFDGFNMYHAIDALNKPHLKWLNLKALTETFLTTSDLLERVVYFSAYMNWEREKHNRHKEYVLALKSTGVEPVMSKFQNSRKYCNRSAQYCDFKEEKQTDVAFGVRIICECLVDEVERVIIVTADSDQVPTIAAIKALRPRIQVSVRVPPGRIGIARELGEVAHDIREISPGQIEKCIFPRNVRDKRGVIVARCPALYEHPRPLD